MVGTYWLCLNTRTYLLGTFTVPNLHLPKYKQKNQGLQKREKQKFKISKRNDLNTTYPVAFSKFFLGQISGDDGKKNTQVRNYLIRGRKKSSNRCLSWSALIGLEGQIFGVSKLIYG
jgi:hypothetical protein